MISIQGLNIADCIIVAVVAISTLISLFRGFLKECISLCIWAVGFWAAIRFHHAVAVILEPYIKNANLREIAGYLVVFLSILISGSIFNYLLSLIVARSGLSGTDRLLGMVFGSTRGVLLVAVILLLIASTSFVQDDWWKKSVLIPHFQSLIEWLKAFLPEKLVYITSAVK